MRPGDVKSFVQGHIQNKYWVQIQHHSVYFYPLNYIALFVGLHHMQYALT